MPDLKISQLPSSTLPLSGTELAAIVQDNVTKKVTLTEMFTNTSSPIPADAISNTPSGSIIATDVQAAIDELDTEKAPLASPTFTGTVTSPDFNVSGGTASQILATDGSKNIETLSTDTYPNLTELSYVKGVTSSIQTQINGKQASLTNPLVSSSASPSDTNFPIFNGNGIQVTPQTVTQVTALLNAVVGDSGSGGTKGMVPAPASGDAASGKFLKADGTWSVAPGSFTPTISSVQTGDGITYNGTAWVNGFYTKAPTVSNPTTNTISVGNLVSPNSWNGSSSVTMRTYVYTDSGRTIQVSGSPFTTNAQSKTFTVGSGNELPSYSTLYYLSTQVKPNDANYPNSYSPLTNSTLTTGSEDKIVASLSTSLAAYNEASTGAFVAITSTEYANLITNVSTNQTIVGQNPMGNNSVTSYPQSPITEIYSTGNFSTQWPTNGYFVAFTYTGSGDGAGVDHIITASGSTAFTQNSVNCKVFNPSVNNQNTQYYYVIKSPPSGVRFTGYVVLSSSSSWSFCGRTNGTNTVRNYNSSTAVTQSGGTTTNSVTVSSSDTIVGPNIQFLTTTTVQWQ